MRSPWQKGGKEATGSSGGLVCQRHTLCQVAICIDGVCVSEVRDASVRWLASVGWLRGHPPARVGYLWPGNPEKLTPLTQAVILLAFQPAPCTTASQSQP